MHKGRVSLRTYNKAHIQWCGVILEINTFAAEGAQLSVSQSHYEMCVAVFDWSWDSQQGY